MFEYKQFYERKLPHIHSPGGTLFVTFRLAGTIPRTVLHRWKAERKMIDSIVQRLSGSPDLDEEEKIKRFHQKWFSHFEDILHKAATGPVWLRDPNVADIVANSLKFHDDRSYKLHAYCIMSNHAHVSFTPFLDERSLKETRKDGRTLYESEYPTLAAIMKSIKGYSARECNKLLGRTGQFWEPESYDHEIRSDDGFWRVIKYILRNPVKAGLVENWRDYPHSWAAEGLSSIDLV